MRLILLKSWLTKRGKRYAVGSIVQVTDSLGDGMVKTKQAKEYEGEYPPKKKVKTDFFKPKE